MYIVGDDETKPRLAGHDDATNTASKIFIEPGT